MQTEKAQSPPWMELRGEERHDQRRRSELSVGSAGCSGRMVLKFVGLMLFGVEQRPQDVSIGCLCKA